MAWFTFPFTMLSNGVVYLPIQFNGVCFLMAWFNFPFNMLSIGVVYLPIQYAF